MTHGTVLNRSLRTEITVCARAPSPSCNYIFLKCILYKGEDQPETRLQDKAVGVDAVSVLELRLFVKGVSANHFVIQSIFNSSKKNEV